MSIRDRYFVSDLDAPCEPRVGLFDVIGRFGDIEPRLVAEILLLQPTAAELDAVASALEAGPGSAAPLAGTCAAIYELVAGSDAANR